MHSCQLTVSADGDGLGHSGPHLRTITSKPQFGRSSVFSLSPHSAYPASPAGSS